MLTAEAADEPNAEPTLAAATEVQRLDVAAMHEKALGILATLKASTVALGWNQEDDAAGVVKYGVANYEPARKSAAAPVRPPQPALCLAPQPALCLAPVRPPLDHDEMPLLM